MKSLRQTIVVILYIISLTLIAAGILIQAKVFDFTSRYILLCGALSILSIIFATMAKHTYLYSGKDKARAIRYCFRECLIVYILILIWLSMFDGVFSRMSFDFANSFQDFSNRFNITKNLNFSNSIMNDIDNITTYNSAVHLFGNIALFIPFGILIPSAFRKMRNIIAFIISVLVVTILIELTQVFCGVGRFDIDEIFLNTAGGMIGFGITCIRPIKRRIERTNFKRY